MTDLDTVMEPAQRKLSGFSISETGSSQRHLALLIAFLFTLQGCATLPDARRDRAEPHAQQVEFESERGPVSAATSDAIVVQLEGMGGDSDVLQKHLAYEQSVNAKSPLVLGNKLTLLQNGPATYEAMFASIREARDHINLETYIFSDDEVGQKFAELLLERQAAGIQVNLIYDSIGALDTPAAFYDRLREGGIQVLEFNPINPLEGKQPGWGLNNRDHRKLLIIDGRTAFTGGINISNTYSSSPGGRDRQARDQDPKAGSGWRDTHVQIDGPVVTHFQKLFMGTWARQNGDALVPKNYFPYLEDQGNEIVRAIGSTPADKDSLIFLTLLSAITNSSKQVHLTIAYFSPDLQLLQALTDAAERGVDVKLVLPAYSDSGMNFHLGRSYYTTLLKAGVKLYERQGAVSHAKTVSIDGVWTTIGSTNLDSRSFLHNDEINAVILGRNFAAQMETMFNQDLAESEAILLDQWRRRSLIFRLKEQAARVGTYWL